VRRIGILYAPKIEAAQELGLELEEWLTRLEVEVWRASPYEDDAEAPPSDISDCDLVLTLGGDGTALRAAHLTAPVGVPLLCVGMGRLSFMAELTPDDVLRELPALLAGDFWLEKRSLLEGVVIRRGQETTRCLALNEVVVGRERNALTLRVAARVNDAYLTTYTGDAVIVATATGSTAYALSAGGPILFPESRNLLLVPVAAHLCLLPPIVLPQGARLELEMVRDSAAGVSADGRDISALQMGDVLRVQCSPTCCHFARLQGRDYFYRTLKARLFRGD
jgi:NAD+ kinase